MYDNNKTAPYPPEVRGGGFGSQAAKTLKEPEIPLALNNLQKEVEGLNDEINLLISRLNPVSCPGPVAPDTGDKQNPEPYGLLEPIARIRRGVAVASKQVRCATSNLMI